MTRNVKYLCAKDGVFWSSYQSPTPRSAGLAPDTAACPTCREQCPRVHRSTGATRGRAP